MGCTLQLGCPGNTLFVTGWVWAYWTHPGYDPGIKPGAPSLQADSLPPEPPGKLLLARAAQLL